MKFRKQILIVFTISFLLTLVFIPISSSIAADDSCVGKCGQWDTSWSCNCDDLCQDYQDCCPDYEQLCVGSCEGKCGQWDTSWSCNCDDLCQQYGDCCPDYQQQCGGTTDSCAGKCGQWDTSWSCNCDNLCQQYGDCCPDYQQQCGGTADSCEGKCGQWDTSWSCNCDDLCQDYQDCCPDYEQLCVSQPTCEGKCGQHNASWSCQCDVTCQQRGDCCLEFDKCPPGYDELPDFQVRFISFCHQYQSDFYNQKWTATIQVKNYGGSKGMSLGNQLPIYVNMTYYDEHYNWNYQTSTWDHVIETKHKTEVLWTGAPMAGQVVYVVFEDALRDTGPAHPSNYRFMIPKDLHSLADYVEGPWPGVIVESNEYNNAGGTYDVSYLQGDTIVTNYPNKYCWWFYGANY